MPIASRYSSVIISGTPAKVRSRISFVMTSRNDYLRFMAPPLHGLLRMKGAESVLRIYGKKEEKDIGHVFHLNCHQPLADQCNDEQCAFFRAHMDK